MWRCRTDWERLFENDAIDPVVIGATESKSDVFTPSPKDEPFEPEFDWDKTAEPPIVVEKQTRALIAQPVKARAISAIGASASRTIAPAERLTVATLQVSQNQLNESIVDKDPFTSVTTTADYRFSLFYHPYVCDFLKEARRLGVEGLLDPNPDGPAADLVRQKKQLEFFAGTYDPTSRALEPYPIQKIDFDVTGAYSGYNWEVFFHAPLLIANRLFQDQRFEEARRWLHFIFDPTSRSDEPDALRFWKIQPFYRPADAPIGEFLELAASTDNSPEVEAAREQYDQQVNAWLADPFNPHAIARLRTTAYQKSVVMKYLDNLIGWGDNLFRQDTIESIDEARHSLASAERSLDVVQERRDYYQNLISAGWLPEESEQKRLMEKARGQQLRGSAASILAGGLSLIPEINSGVSGISGSPVLVATIVSGIALAKAAETGAQAWSMDASAKSAEASISSLTAGFARRAEEWRHQLELGKREIKQIEKQIEAGKIRVALAERDMENHERQIENARSVREFMENKFTNTELYQWMAGQLSSLYFQSYQLSYDLAKKAEQAYRHELALPDSTFIKFGYWDSLKKGLLAGERLQYDLERMDAAYLENNRREYEITKHLSLASLDPVALLKLTTEGYCEFSIPESLFDIDYPGHYLRRVKSVSVTVPCVSGPYTNAPCRLTLVSSRTRIDPSAASDYPFNVAGNDSRFQSHTGAVESIVVSGGREDAGLFAPDHRDERYLPFEGAGAISDWSLKLTSAVPTFDWSTITDVVLHMRYTAREGGDALGDKAIESLSAALAGIPLRRAFSARREFPTEWNAFLHPAVGATEATLKVELSENRFPYIARDAGLSVRELQLVALVNDPAGPVDWTPTDVEVITGNQRNSAVLVSTESEFAGHPNATLAYGGAAPGVWTVIVPTTSLGAPSEWMEDLALVVTYEINLTS